MSEFPHILSRNLLQEAATVSSSVAQDAIYRLAHLTDRSRLSEWRGVSGTAQQIVQWNFAAPVQIDTFVLDRGFTLTGSVVVYFEHSADGVNWTAAVTINAPATASIYWRTFTAVTKQYWRLRITGLSAAPVIQNVWGGKRIELTFGPDGDFDPDEKENIGDPSDGLTGGFQWSQKYTRRVLNVDFDNLTDTKYTLIRQWITEAAEDGLNWWWLTYPSSAPTDPLFLNGRGMAIRFPIRSSVRYGSITASEVL